jgi:hypothetical protein
MASDVGICRICLREAKLTYEHVPMKRVQDGKAVKAETINHPNAVEKNFPIGGVIRYPRGLGLNTLCEACNGHTAHFYGEAFAEWVAQAAEHAAKHPWVEGAENTYDLPFTIKPLAVLKQIATMALTVTQLNDDAALNRLREFVLYPLEPLKARNVSFRVYLNPKRPELKTPQTRLNGMGVVTNTKKGEITHTIAEITFPPLGYWVAWINDRHPPLAEFSSLLDVTHFGQFGWDDTLSGALRMPVKLPVGPIVFHEQYVSTK